MVNAPAEELYDLLVIGGGAAGYFAAINAAESTKGKRIAILEATPRVLTKVKVSGGGRCNVTHHLFDPLRFSKNYPRGSKELLGPFHRFGAQETVQWFEKRGVSLKAEDDGRMFPQTNSSQTIIDALEQARLHAGVELKTKAWVDTLKKDSSLSLFHVHLKDGRSFSARFVVLATGSMPAGHALLEQMGQELIAPVPSLFTFEISDPLLDELSGQHFPLVRATLSVAGSKKPFVQEGPCLITHWGLSGPAILKLSAFAARELAASQYQAQLTIQWSSAMNEAQALDALLQCKEQFAKRLLSSENPLPCSKRFWERLCELRGIDTSQVWAQVTKKSLQSIAQLFSRSELKVSGKGVFKEEFVTAGGVPRAAVDFRSMESRLCPGLYFAGEIVDIDGITGGFNFQNAWTGGWLAAQHIAAQLNT